MEAVYIVLNMGDLLPFSLRSIYDYVDKIIIGEGAVLNAKHMATPNGHSLDNTLEAIKSFPDPNGKIKLITKDGFWRDKSEVLDACASQVKSSWLLRIDGDEVFKKADIEKLRRFTQKDKDTFTVYCKFIHFWKNPHTIIKGGIWDRSPHVTLFRTDNGIHHAGYHHCFPRDNLGRDLRRHPYYHDKQKRLNNVHVYHYGYMRNAERIKEKLVFFGKRNGKLSENEAEKQIKKHGWFSGKLNPEHRLEPFRGTHPEVMEEYFRRLK